MGLDINYYQNAKLIDPPPFASPEEEEHWRDENYKHIVLAYHAGFPESFGSLESDRYYEVSGECGSFRAGSYSGYNWFREAVWRLANKDVPIQKLWDNPEQYRDRPFFLWANFSDCEGCIGPDACTKLAEDFSSQAEIVSSGLDEYDRNTYLEWVKAFRTAANTGLVSYH